MDEAAAAIWNKISEVKDRYDDGKLTQDEAKAIVEPLLSILNIRAEKLSKKQGRRYIPITFLTAMRHPMLVKSVGETKARHQENNK